MRLLQVLEKQIAGCETTGGFFGSVGSLVGGSGEDHHAEGEASVLERTPAMLAAEWALLPVVHLLNSARRSSVAAAASTSAGRSVKRGRDDDEEQSGGDGKRSRRE